MIRAVFQAPIPFLALAWAFQASGANVPKQVEVNVVVDMTPEGRLTPPPSADHPAYYLPVVAGYQELGALVSGEHPPTPRDVEHTLAISLAKQGYRVMNLAPNTNTRGQLTYADGTVVTVPVLPDLRHPIRLNAPGNVPLTTAMMNAPGGPYSAQLDRAGAPGGQPLPPLLQVLRAVDPVHGPVMRGRPSLILAFEWGYINPDVSNFGDPDDVTQQVFFNENQMLALVAGNALKNVGFDFFANQAATLAATEDRYFAVITAYDYDAFAKGRRRVVLWQAKMSVPSAGLWYDGVLAALAEAGGPFFGRETAMPKQLRLPVTPEGTVRVGTPVVKDYQNAPGPAAAASTGAK